MKYRLCKIIILLILIFRGQNSLSAQLISYDSLKNYIREIPTRYPQNPDSIILIFNQILQSKEVQSDDNKKAYVLLYLGLAYSYEKHESAVGHTYFQKSLDLARKINNCDIEILSQISLTLLYFELGQLDKLINTYEQAISLAKNCPANNKELYIITQLGINYATTNQFKKADYYYKMGDSILNLNKNINPDDIVFYYSSIISYYRSQSNSQKANFYIEQAKLNILKNIKSDKRNDDLSKYLFIIDIFKNVGLIDSAIYYANQLAQLPLKDYAEYNQLWIKRVDNVLSNLYFEKGDLKKAFYYKDKYSGYLDSLNETYMHGNANGQVKTLENSLMLEKQKNQTNQNKIIAISIGLLTLVALTFLVISHKNAQKLKQLNTTLENQKQELSSLNEIRTKMFSILSHDLLSPIGALKNMVELYQKKSLSKEDFDTYTVDLKRSLDAILNNLTNILEWSYAQLKGKKAFIDTLDVHEIINDQLALQLEVARQKNIELISNVPTGFSISADVNQFSLIVRNLLNNALKYTPNGGKVEINAYNTEGCKIIEVKDNGIGMSEQKVKQLFRPSEKRSFAPHGKGLGLEMVNDLLEANNCTITVKSKENEGSIFTLFFTKKNTPSKR